MNNQEKYWASSKVTGPLHPCPEELTRVSPLMMRGGARPRTGKKVKPEDKRVQKSFMIHPNTWKIIQKTSIEYDESFGLAIDRIASQYLQTDTNKKGS